MPLPRDEDAGADGEVRVQNGQTVGVVEGQDECRPIRLLETKIGSDRLRIGLHVPFGESHELLLARTAGGREEQCEIRVKPFSSFAAGVEPAPPAVSLSEDDVGLEFGLEFSESVRIVRRKQSDDMPRFQGG
jgi:hypothetical protein